VPQWRVVSEELWTGPWQLAIAKGVDAHRVPDVKRAIADIREYAYKSMMNMHSLFRAVLQKAKVKLAQHVKELVLTAVKPDEQWALTR
jgi:hypothetical protein